MKNLGLNTLAQLNTLSQNLIVSTVIEYLNSIGVNNPSIGEIKSYMSGLKNGNDFKTKYLKTH